MSEKPISPLRQRMIDDMTARRFSEKVQKAYVRHVKTFAAFLSRSPDTATSEDLRRFQLHMAQQQMSAGSINAAVAALRFFFTVTLERPDLVRPLTTVNKPRKAPGRAERGGSGASPRSRARLKYRAALSVAYGVNLRVSQVANLKVSDIDSERMTLRVRAGQQTLWLRASWPACGERSRARAVEWALNGPSHGRDLNHRRYEAINATALGGR